MKKAIIILAMALLAACARVDENPAHEKTEIFNTNSIPCGTLMKSAMPELVIFTDDGKLVKKTVPEWVWKTYQNSEGQKIGNCGYADNENTEIDTTETE